MKTLDNYIIEKLKLDKDTKVSKDAVMPTNKEEYIELIDTYFKEWWDDDSPKSLTSKNYKDSYDYIIQKINSKDFSPYTFHTEYLPYKFVKYMNSKYNIGWDLLG